MATLSRIVDLANEFVTMHDLHDSIDWVDLSVLESRYVPDYVAIEDRTIIGYSLYPPERPITPHNPAKVFIDHELQPDESRLVYAHEIGHEIAGHQEAFTTTELGGSLHNLYEREAWLAAAVMLIPGHIINTVQSDEEVIQNTGVPLWLIEMYYESIQRSYIS